MTRWIVAGLVVLNLVLSAVVVQRLGLEKPAQAQPVGIGQGIRGDFAVVAGYSNNQTIIYLLEYNTGQLYAFRTDPVNKRIELVNRADVARAMAVIR